MLLIVKALHSVLKLLNSETSRWQIAAGLSFGLLVGLTPALSLHNLFLILLVFLLRVNLSAFFLSLGLFEVLGILFSPVWDFVGYKILVDLKMARPLWVELTTGSVWPFFHFNNTVLMGSLSTAIFLTPFVFFGGAAAIQIYRTHLREKILGSGFMKVLKATPFYSIYSKYQASKQKLGLS